MAFLRPALRLLGALPGAAYARAAAAFWTLRGCRALARGELARGVKALEQAVSWRPTGYKPLLRLALAYLRTDEIWGAHRALARARESAPGPFSRSAAAWMTRHGADPALLEQILTMAPAPARAESKVPLAARLVLEARAVGPTSLPYGDCRTVDEYARFVTMPPISRAEIESTDWDRLLADLLED